MIQDNNNFETGMLRAEVNGLMSDVAEIKKDVKDIAAMVISLREWKAKVLAVSVAGSAAASFVIEVVIKWMR